MLPSSPPPPCPECGAEQRFGTCHELFLALLAHDYEQRRPYADWHTLNVAGYLLQHPSMTRPRVLAGQWEVAQRFARDGLVGVHAIIEGAVRRNSHRTATALSAEPVQPEAPVARRRPHVTIENVSVDGTFPAEGFAERMRQWILDTIRCYS